MEMILIILDINEKKVMKKDSHIFHNLNEVYNLAGTKCQMKWKLSI